MLPDDTIERFLHHEISSWVLDQVDRETFEVSWREHVPDGFDYIGYHAFGAYWRRPENIPYLASALRQLGFARPYGLTNFENDFNTIAELAFFADTEFEDGVARHVAAKLSLMQQAYEVAGVRFGMEIEETPPPAFDLAPWTPTGVPR